MSLRLFTRALFRTTAAPGLAAARNIHVSSCLSSNKPGIPPKQIQEEYEEHRVEDPKPSASVSSKHRFEEPKVSHSVRLLLTVEIR